MIFFILWSFFIHVAGAQDVSRCSSYQVQISKQPPLITCAPFTSAQIPKSLQIGTYNLNGLSNLKGLKSDLEHLKSVAIWVFQEVVEENPQDRPPRKLLQILPAGTWFLAYLPVASEPSYRNQIEGMAIVSRFPFDLQKSEPLQHSGVKPRYALTIRIRRNPHSLWILNTDHEVAPFFIGFSDRKKQLESLKDIFKNIPAHNKLVVLGDWNTAGDQNLFHYMSSAEEVHRTYAFMKDLNFEWPHSLPESEYTFESFWIRNHLDHIFLKNIKPQAWQKYSKRQGSDHFPVFTEIIF